MAEQSSEEFLSLAQSRFKLAAEAESESRRASLDDLEFSIGNQWPQDIKAQRQLDGRPCLTMNLLPQYIRQVTNEQRQQRPAIQVNPVGSDADVDTAEIIQGICRHIEVNSKADEAYDEAFDYMVRIGFGAWRVVTDYIAEESEDQEIYIEPIDNPFTVYMDPTNKRNPGWCFIVEDLLADEFKRQFPDARYSQGSANLTDYESVGDQPASWALTIDGQPHIRIAEYFYTEQSTGDKGRKKQKVFWSKISGLDILDKQDWPGKYIPIIKIYGDDLNVNGKRHQAGLVRYAKDPQRARNYWISAATERIALAPKAPWLIAEGQIEGYERQWEQSNVRNMVTLTYKPKALGGQQVPEPQRNVVEPGIQGMTEMIQLANADMQGTTGLYPNSLGDRQSANESGKAVLARQKQGDVATLNYSDNLARGITMTGNIIIDLIPKVYPSAKVQRIIKPDQTVAQVGIYNSTNESEEEARQSIDPEIKNIYDIGVGTYDVTVSTGPSYQTKRQEAVETQLALVQANPNLFPIIGDLVVRNMDIPGAREIADRLKKMLPPNLVDSEDQSPEAQVVQLHQQLQQMSQQHQLLTQALGDAQKVIETKQIENQGKFAIANMQEESAQKITQMKLDAEVAIAEVNTKSQDINQRIQWLQDVWTELHGSAHEMAMQAHQQQHEQGLAAQQGAQDQQAQASDQQHEAGMAASGQAHEVGMAAVQSQNGDGE